MLVEKQDQFTKFTIGSNFVATSIFAGIWARGFTSGEQDAISLLLGYQRDYIKVAYSYDVTLSDASGKTGGSHELSITIQPFKDFRYKGKAKWSKFIECPVVF